MLAGLLGLVVKWLSWLVDQVFLVGIEGRLPLNPGVEHFLVLVGFVAGSEHVDGTLASGVVGRCGEIEGVVVFGVGLPLLEEFEEGVVGGLVVGFGGARLALEDFCEADVPGFHS